MNFKEFKKVVLENMEKIFFKRTEKMRQMKLISDEEIVNGYIAGEYFAVCDDGKKYEVYYDPNECNLFGGLYVVPIPSGVRILGYEKKLVHGRD